MSGRKKKSGAVDDVLTGDAGDGQAVKLHCTDRWKAAAKDSQKGSFEVFDQTGMFGGTCRHGMILIFCEIWRSGEL